MPPFVMRTSRKTLFLLLHLALALAAAAGQRMPPWPTRSTGSSPSGSFSLPLSRHGQSGAVLAGTLFLLLDGAARTFGGCAAQDTGVGTVKALVKVSNGPSRGKLLGLEDKFGTSVASVGDVDGDSVDDICVGAENDDDGTSRARIAIPAPLKRSQKISATTGGLSESGVLLKDIFYFGRSLAAAGDLDGDSVPDICVGANKDSLGSTRGAVYVLFLNRNGTVKGAQIISDALGGLRESGSRLDNGDWFGVTVASLGDFDGNSVTDICVGAMGDDDGGTTGSASNRGAVYVLFLHTNGTVKASQKISNTQGGLEESGSRLGKFDLFGCSVSAAGDLDGDSVNDICVGARNDDDGGTQSYNDYGAVFVLFLNRNGTVKASQKISKTKGGLSASGVALESVDNFGASIASVGDFDGVSCPTFANGTVKASQQIVLPAGSVPLDDYDIFGQSITSAGDIDGDSVNDICVGAPYDDDGGNDKGARYMLFLRGNSTEGTTSTGLPAASTTTASLTTSTFTPSTSLNLTSSTSASSLSSAVVTTLAPGVTTAAAGENPSGSSDSVNSNPLTIVSVALACTLLLVCAIVATFFYYRARHSDADDVTLSGLQEVELAERSAYDVLDGLPKSNAGSRHNTLADKLDVEITREVGEGAFGAVFLGRWSQQDVAVKCVQSGDADELVAELNILEMLNHPRIVRVFGVAEVKGNPAIVMEWCAHGSLDVLLRARQEFGPSHFLRFCLQISQGLSFLSSKGVLHRDLACRNVLADEVDNVKITDFGLSRNADVTGQYLVTSAVPVRWTAVEVLHDLAASFKSDVFSLGIVFVEIYSRAEKPYADLASNAEVIAAVLGGRRPGQPSLMPDDVYGLAAECWVPSPDERPDASKVAESLECMQLLEKGDSPDIDSFALASSTEVPIHIVTNRTGRTEASDYGVRSALPPNSFSTSTEEQVDVGFNDSVSVTTTNITTRAERPAFPDAEHTNYAQMPSPDADHTDYAQMPSPGAEHTDYAQMPSPDAEYTDYAQMPSPGADHTDFSQMSSPSDTAVNRHYPPGLRGTIDSDSTTRNS